MPLFSKSTMDRMKRHLTPECPRIKELDLISIAPRTQSRGMMFRDSDNVLASALCLYKLVGSTPMCSWSMMVRDNERKSEERVVARRSAPLSWVLRWGKNLDVELTTSTHPSSNTINALPSFDHGVNDVTGLLDVAPNSRVWWQSDLWHSFLWFRKWPRVTWGCDDGR